MRFAQLLLLWAVVTVPLSAEWMPLVAKYSKTITRVAPDGSETIVDQVRGIFLRSASGNELTTRQVVVDGVEHAPSSASFIDRVNGRNYQIVYGDKLALLRARTEPQPNPIPKTAEYLRKAEKKTLGRKSVNGIDCYALPARGHADMEHKVSGVTWRSLDYDFSVKTEALLQTDEGLLRNVREVYDIQVGLEPDATQLKIPNDFRTVDEITEVPPRRSLR